MAEGVRAAGTTLLERGEELAGIQQAITALEGGDGCVLIIQGAAGIGKSSLLHVLCQDAAEQDTQTLTAQASELEREFGFGVVRQLLERRVARAGPSEQAELLAGAARLAAPVPDLGGSVGDPFAAVHGLYWLLANVAAGGPVVLAVDDAGCCVGGEPEIRQAWSMRRRCRRVAALGSSFAGFRYPPDVILVAVRWYLRYALSYRDVESCWPNAASSSIT